MANFTFEKYNSMPEQVEENKKNIKELIKYIKPVYKCTVALTTSTISVAISDTNAPDDTTQGWLIDENGLLFHITNGDGTNLLIEYYASIKGDTGATGQNGADGQDGADGQNGTDGTGVILLIGQQLTIGQTSIILDSYFNQPPQFNDVILDEHGTVGTVTNIIGSDVYVLGEFSIKGETGADGTTNGLIAFNNIIVDPNDFVSSVEYVDYPYECVVINSSSIIGVVSGGMVTFDVEQANSGDYASVCKIDDSIGTVTIYSKVVPNASFVIPNIWVVKSA